MLYNIYTEGGTFLDTIEVEGWTKDLDLYENKIYFTWQYLDGTVEIKQLVDANDFIYKTIFDHVYARKTQN